MSNGVRRVADIAVAVIVLGLGSPIVLLVAAAVWLSLGSPVFYRQERLGLSGKPFTIYKFRTMRQPQAGRESSEFDSERVTRTGQFLRSTSLDELPGFVNLLRGDITLVGPRPLPTKYWDRFVGDEYRRFDVRPGITGLAQINGRNRLEWDERLALDVHYVRTRSLRGDLVILFRTIPVVMSGTGVNRDVADGAIVTMTELPVGRGLRT